ncbi:hypothetical protein DFH29DRAFT_995560 [Suillus ampliporus]|nr:hypothetical protein DFH29DRAFT_995560 [Suillus ampliporus]
MACDPKTLLAAAPLSGQSEMPEYWQVPVRDGTFVSHMKSVLFQGLCLMSVSRTTLHDHWKSKVSDEGWEKHRVLIVTRLNNFNIAAGLVLATSSAFLCSNAPHGSLLQYDSVYSYFLSLAALAQSLCGLLLGVAVVNVYDSCDREWSKDVRIPPIRMTRYMTNMQVLTNTRFRLCVTLILIAMPVLELASSIICLMLALLAAVYASGL